MTPERVSVIYASISKLVIELDPDPISRGPSYLLNLISKTRGFLNEVSFYLHEVLCERHELELQLQAGEDAYSVLSNEMLATNTEVKALASIEDRTAMIAVKLKPELKEIQKLKRLIKNVSHVEKVVRHRSKELESTMSAIRLQRSLIESDIRTGAVYGDSNEVSRGKGNGRGRPVNLRSLEDLSDEEELTKLFEDEDQAPTPEPTDADPGVKSELSESPATPFAPSPLEPPDAKDLGASEVAQIDRFLAGDFDDDIAALLQTV